MISLMSLLSSSQNYLLQMDMSLEIGRLRSILGWIKVWNLLLIYVALLFVYLAL